LTLVSFRRISVRTYQSLWVLLILDLLIMRGPSVVLLRIRRALSYIFSIDELRMRDR